MLVTGVSTSARSCKATKEHWLRLVIFVLVRDRVTKDGHVH